MINKNSATENVANALVDLAMEENKLRDLYTDLVNLSEFIKNDDSFMHFLRLSNIDKKQKINNLMQLQNLFCFDKTLNAIGLLVEANTVYLIQDVIRDCLKQTEEELGIVHMRIYAPFKLSDEQLNQIENAITARKDLLPENFQKIKYEFHIDENLIGGIKVSINNQIIDNSYLAKLLQGKDATLKQK